MLLQAILFLEVTPATVWAGVAHHGDGLLVVVGCWLLLVGVGCVLRNGGQNVRELLVVSLVKGEQFWINLGTIMSLV